MAGYKLRDLGFARQGLRDVIWFVPPLMLLTGGSALLVDPQGVTFARGVEKFGSWYSLLLGIFLTAALPEEWSRVLLQSRVGALTTRARGWFIASLIWGLLHVPVWAAGTGDVVGAMWGAIRVVPLGLMWGYVTHRTGNIWTAWVLHATNLWGLQNF